MNLSVADPHLRQQLSDQEWQVSNTTTTMPSQATLTDSPPGNRQLRFPFDRGEFVVEIVGDPPAWVEPTVRSLGGLLSLEPGWDSYGANPVDPNCVVAALELAMATLRNDSPAPSVVPTSRGALQLEWHIGGIDLEVEFLSATRICGLFEDQRTGKAWEKDLSFDLRPLVDAISTLSQRC